MTQNTDSIHAKQTKSNSCTSWWFWYMQMRTSSLSSRINWPRLDSRLQGNWTWTKLLPLEESPTGPESLPPHNVLSKSSTHPNIDKQKEVPLDVHLSPRRRSQHPKLHCANPCPETTLMLLGQSGDLNCQPDMRGRHEWCKLLSNRWAVKIMYFNINARSVIPKTDELWAIAEAKTSWLG